MDSLGITWEELDIRPRPTQMLKDLGHPFGRGEEVYDVTFENVQAGLRTDYLFRAANQRGGIVLGTGDLSELALGWCTYGVGDQMSHYGVNAGVPKTLMQHLIRWVVASQQFEGPVNGTLHDPRPGDQPELDPDRRRASASVHRGLGRPLRPAGLHALPRAAPRLPPEQDRLPRRHAWRMPGAGCGRRGTRKARGTAYDLATIRRWLRFHWRFFANQFKRSAIPTGRRSSRAVRCRRAVTGGCRRTPGRVLGWPSSRRTSRRPSWLRPR
jgi:NAD+ synthase (glutamine-hydrolysing)